MVSAYSIEVGLIISIILGSIFLFVLYRTLVFGIQCKNFIETSAELIYLNKALQAVPLNMKKHCGYKYIYGGQHYVGYCVSPLNYVAPFIFAPSKSVLDRLERRNRMGGKITVFVNPQRPKQALVSITFNRFDLFQILASIAIVLLSFTYIAISNITFGA